MLKIREIFRTFSPAGEVICTINNHFLTDLVLGAGNPVIHLFEPEIAEYRMLLKKYPQEIAAARIFPSGFTLTNRDEKLSLSLDQYTGIDESAPLAGGVFTTGKNTDKILISAQEENLLEVLRGAEKSFRKKYFDYIIFTSGERDEWQLNEINSLLQNNGYYGYSCNQPEFSYYPVQYLQEWEKEGLYLYVADRLVTKVEQHLFRQYGLKYLLLFYRLNSRDVLDLSLNPGKIISKVIPSEIKAVFLKAPEPLEIDGFKLVRKFKSADQPESSLFYLRDPVITMNTLGKFGRFANQVFQYAFIKTYARQHGLKVLLPEWPGRQFFQADEEYLKEHLPVYYEAAEHQPSYFFSGGENTEQDNYLALANVDIRGFFQYHSSYFAGDKNYFRQLFTFRPELERQLQQLRDKIFGQNRTIIALHLRRGDFGYSYFFIAPTAWYRVLLAKIWHLYENPVLFIASDEPEKVLDDFRDYQPVTSLENGIIPEQLASLADFYLLAQARVLAISNSSFSYAAAMLSTRGKEFYRPSLADQALITFDPWDSEILLREEEVKVTQVKGIQAGNKIIPVAEMLKNIRELDKKGNRIMAEILLDLLLVKYPAEIEALEIKAKYMYAGRRIPALTDTLKKLVKADPEQPRHLLNLTSVLWQNGNIYEALDYFRQGYQKFPDHPLLIYQYAKSLMLAGLMPDLKQLLLRSDDKNTRENLLAYYLRQEIGFQLEQAFFPGLGYLEHPDSPALINYEHKLLTKIRVREQKTDANLKYFNGFSLLPEIIEAYSNLDFYLTSRADDIREGFRFLLAFPDPPPSSLEILTDYYYPTGEIWVPDQDSADKYLQLGVNRDKLRVINQGDGVLIAVDQAVLEIYRKYGKAGKGDH